MQLILYVCTCMSLSASRQVSAYMQVYFQCSLPGLHDGLRKGD